MSGVVGHALPFPQVVKSPAFDVRRVEEHVLVGPGLDEPEAFVRQPFNLSFSHQIPFSKKTLPRCSTQIDQAASLHEDIITRGAVKSTA